MLEVDVALVNLTLLQIPKKKFGAHDSDVFNFGL